MNSNNVAKLAGACVGCIATAALSRLMDAMASPSTTNVIWTTLFVGVASAAGLGIWNRSKWGVLSAVILIALSLYPFVILAQSFYHQIRFPVLQYANRISSILILTIALIADAYVTYRGKNKTA